MNAITVDADNQRRIFNHFALRLGERFGQDIDALPLWRALAFALAQDNRDLLRPFVRVSRQGRRVFICRLADARFCFVLFDCQLGLPITVFSEGMVVQCEGKGKVCLEVPNDLR